jgi:hypothetical protein
MWQGILNALLKAVEDHPEQVLTIVQDLVELFKANPNEFKLAVQTICNQFPPKAV